MGLMLSSEAVLTGKIVSCPAWTLNRHKTLKSFLKDGEAEEYEGITIEWIRGKHTEDMLIVRR